MLSRKVWFGVTILTLIGVLLAAFVVYRSGRGNRGGAESADGPATARVERRDIQFSIEITGDVTPCVAGGDQA